MMQNHSDTSDRHAAAFSDGRTPDNNLTPPPASTADSDRAPATAAESTGGTDRENTDLSGTPGTAVSGGAAPGTDARAPENDSAPLSGGVTETAEAGTGVWQTGEEISAAAGAETAAENGEGAETPAVDYADVAARDLEVLRRTFPACAEMDSLCRLENPLRYAQLRDLGLSPEEAYLATAHAHTHPDNRSHLTSSVPRAAAGGIGMTAAQLSAARELFEGLSDAELTRLYRRAMS